MPPDPPSLVCLYKLDIHVTPLLKILATGLLTLTPQYMFCISTSRDVQGVRSKLLMWSENQISV